MKPYKRIFTIVVDSFRHRGDAECDGIEDDGM